MITFDRDNTCFLFRAVGIVIHDHHVLLHHAEQDNFWSLPGGRVELMERAETAIVREMREELGIAVTIERLVWVVENFFGYKQKSYHELSCYFLLQLPEDSTLLNKTSKLSGQEDFYGQETNISLIFKWFPLAQLDALELYPTFLKTSLTSLPKEIKYLSHIDNDTVVVT